MEIKESVFLYRGNGSLKKVSTKQWQALLNGSDTCSELRDGRFRFLQIQFISELKRLTALRSIKAWDIELDAEGMLAGSDWQQLPTPDIDTSLQQLSSTLANTGQNSSDTADDALLNDYIDALLRDCLDSVTRQHPPPQSAGAQLYTHNDIPTLRHTIRIIARSTDRAARRDTAILKTAMRPVVYQSQCPLL